MPEQIKSHLSNLTNFEKRIIIAAVICLVAYALYVIIREIYYNYRQSVNRKNAVVMQIIPRAGTETKDITDFLKFLHGILLGRHKYHVSYEIVAEDNKIKFYLWTPGEIKEVVKNRIMSSFNNVQISEEVADPLNIKKKKVSVSTLKISKHYLLSLNTDVNNIIDSITSVMTGLEKQQRLVVQVLLSAESEKWKRKGERDFRYCERHNRPLRKVNILDYIADGITAISNELGKELHGKGSTGGATFDSIGGNKKSKVDTSEHREALYKLKEPGFSVCIRLIGAGGWKKTNQRISGLSAAFAELSHENRFIRKNNYFYFIRYSGGEFGKAKKRYIQRTLSSLLSVSEIRSFAFQLPTKANDSNEIVRYMSRIIPPPIAATRTENPFALTRWKGKEEVIGIVLKDLLRHINVTGKTGTGKSEFVNLFFNTLVQTGYGGCLIDPHGDLFRDVVPRIPESRRKDVILMDFSEKDHPVPFNFMLIKNRDPIEIERITTEMLSVFQRLFSEAWGGRTEYYFRNAIKTVLEVEPKPTILHIKKLFVDEEYRKKIIPKLKNIALKDYWTKEFGKGNGEMDSATRTALQSPLNKLAVFTDNEHLLYSICQADCIDFRQAMDEKKILIVNVDKGSVGEETCKLIGSMIITKLKLAAMSRSNMEKADRLKAPFIMAVDEFENFVGPEIEVILDELRKYGFGLMMLHQRIEQIQDLKSAVFNNVGTLITFRTGIEDAAYLTKFFKGLDPDDIANLENRQAYCRLLVNGTEQQPFTFWTLDRIELTKEQEIDYYKQVYEQSIAGRKSRDDLSKELYGVEEQEEKKVIGKRQEKPEQFEDIEEARAEGATEECNTESNCGQEPVEKNCNTNSFENEEITVVENRESNKPESEINQEQEGEPPTEEEPIRRRGRRDTEDEW